MKNKLFPDNSSSNPLIYAYCDSHPQYEGLLKIGYTTKSAEERIKQQYPIVNTEDVLGGIYMPGDGAADPSGVTHMLAKAARQEVAQIFEKSPV